MDEKRGEQLIILKEKDGEKRLLPIIIGPYEAEAIRMRVKGITPPRPLTHDLLRSTIKGLGAKLEGIIVDSLSEGIFFAKLMIVTQEGKEVKIDARPSDAIALALRANVPIFVAEEVIDLTTASL
jgi:bifunctional DNase/RNase